MLRAAVFPSDDESGPELVLHNAVTQRQVSIEFSATEADVATVTSIDEEMRRTELVLRCEGIGRLGRWLVGLETK